MTPLGVPWCRGATVRVHVCRSKVLITASGGARAKKVVPLKQIADKAVQLAAASGFQVGACRSGKCNSAWPCSFATPDATNCALGVCEGA